MIFAPSIIAPLEANRIKNCFTIHVLAQFFGARLSVKPFYKITTSYRLYYFSVNPRVTYASFIYDDEIIKCESNIGWAKNFEKRQKELLC